MSSSGGALQRGVVGGRERSPASARLAGAADWLRSHEHVAAGLLLGLLTLVYLWPVLIGGNVLSPRAILFSYAPWRAAAAADWPERTNWILGDIVMSHYPFHLMVRDMLHDGVFPAWSQHAYAGVPFFANPQTLVLSPFALPIWILPLEFGIGLSAALKLWVAGFGTYLLARELRLGFWPGLLAGVSFVLCAFNVVWLTHETLVAVAALLPWNVLLVERIVRRGSRGAAIALACTVAVTMTGGHPGTQVHVLVAMALYALVRAGAVEAITREARARRLLLVGAGTVVGVMLAAVLLLPVLQAGDGTIGVQARIGENASIPGAELPFGAIRTALFPDWWGRPSRLSLAGPANYNERTLYAGGVATLLALVALASAGGWRRKAPFALLAGIGLAVPLHAPVAYWLATHLPVLRQVQPQRMMLLFAFGVALLAGFGLQRLLDAPRERRRALAVLAAAAGTALIALASIGPSGSELGRAAGDVLRLRHAVGGLLVGADPNVAGLATTAVLWWLLVVVVTGLLLALLWLRPRARPLAVVLLVAFAAVELLGFARDYQPMQPASVVDPPRTGAVSYLLRHADDGRFTGIRGDFLNNWLAPLGLRDVRGSDPPQPSLRWFHLWRTFVNGEQLDWAQAIAPSIPGAPELNALSVLGARYVATRSEAEVPPTASQLRVGYRGPDATVYVNPDAVPRAMVAPRVTLTGGEQDTLQTIGDRAFSPRDEAIVERSEPGAAALASTSGAGGRVAVADETTTSVTLDATLRRPGLVVLNDALAPGWSVRVDGEEADAVRVNDVMRGVAVGAGRHEVEWRYRVPGLRLGAALSALALALLAAAAVVHVRARRRGAPPL